MLGFALCLLAPAPALAPEQGHRAPRVRSLRYVESSSGLGTPQLEGGFTEIEMGDVNGDGHVDLVSVGDHGSPYINTNQHGVMVWFGDGTGSWSVVQTGDFGYGGVALGDVNGDGLLDVGYGIHHDYSNTDLGDQILEVALGDGTGTTWTPWDDGLATNGETWGMAGTDFADVDNDGDLDVGSTSFGCCAGVHVYLNDGLGGWTQSFGFLGGNSGSDFVFGEIDGDGHADFAVTHQTGTVWLGDGAGDFVSGDANLPGGGLLGHSGVDLGDVNGDGRDDLSFVSGGAPEVWLRTPAGTWQQAGAGLPATGGFQKTQLADMNVDGWVDLVVFGERDCAVFMGDGRGGFRKIAAFRTPGPGDAEALRVAHDVDHNGYPDIALVADEGTFWNSNNHLRLFREATPAVQPWCSIVRPGRNAVLRRNSVQFVDWVSAVPAGVASSVDLELSWHGPGGPWQTIASGLADNGRHQVLVPNLASNDARLRLTVRLPGGVTSRAISAPFRVQ